MAELALKDGQVATTPQTFDRERVAQPMRMDVDTAPFTPARKELVEFPRGECISAMTAAERPGTAALDQDISLHRPDCLRRNRDIALLSALSHDAGEAPVVAEILECEAAQLARADASVKHEQDDRHVTFRLATRPDRGQESVNL